MGGRPGVRGQTGFVHRWGDPWFEEIRDHGNGWRFEKSDEEAINKRAKLLLELLRRPRRIQDLLGGMQAIENGLRNEVNGFASVLRCLGNVLKVSHNMSMNSAFITKNLEILFSRGFTYVLISTLDIIRVRVTSSCRDQIDMKTLEELQSLFSRYTESSSILPPVSDPLSLTTTGVDSKSNGGSDQIEQRHLPVGSATSPDQTLFASPSLPWKSLLIIFWISNTISTSLDPSLRSSIRLTERATKSSADAKFESWNISIFEEPPILISGVSLKTLI